jgi:hypothetical protein
LSRQPSTVSTREGNVIANTLSTTRAPYLTLEIHAGQWMQTSGTERGTWWDDYVGQLTGHGGPQKPSLAELG